MNLYILVEGKSEKYIYSAWLKHLLPDLIQVDSPYLVDINNYYLFSCCGIPSIITDVPKAIEDMNEIGKFDYLLVALDADELTIDERRQEVIEEIRKQNSSFDESKLIIIVQNRCIETWCLGNRKVFSRQPQTQEFLECNSFYRVNSDDPELMGRDSRVSRTTTIAQYHEYYLRKMLSERNINYSKGKRSQAVQETHYLNELMLRISETDHLASFKYFIEIVNGLKQLLVPQSQIAVAEEDI
ncbi:MULTISPECIES: hypothetical protein [Brevibacillus]|nr:hypothetical protein [Brevibacillus sp.]